MNQGSWNCIGGGDLNHPPEEEMKKAKWLSEESLQIAEKEEKWKAKKIRKDVNIWMQSSKEEQGEIRQLFWINNAKK